MIFEFFSEQKERIFCSPFPSLGHGLQKKVLLSAVCCCGVLSCFCGGLRREREREKKREQERVS